MLTWAGFIATVGRNLLDAMLYQRFLSRLAMLIMLAVITGVMASLLLAGLFYAAYFMLVKHGLEADIAFLTVGIAIAAATVIFAACTVGAVRKFRRMLQPLSPLAAGVNDIADAFMGGLMTQPIHKKSP